MAIWYVEAKRHRKARDRMLCAFYPVESEIDVAKLCVDFAYVYIQRINDEAYARDLEAFKSATKSAQ